MRKNLKDPVYFRKLKNRFFFIFSESMMFQEYVLQILFKIRKIDGAII